MKWLLVNETLAAIPTLLALKLLQDFKGLVKCHMAVQINHYSEHYQGAYPHKEKNMIYKRVILLRSLRFQGLDINETASKVV